MVLLIKYTNLILRVVAETKNQTLYKEIAWVWGTLMSSLEIIIGDICSEYEHCCIARLGILNNIIPEASKDLVLPLYLCMQ